MSTTCGNLIAVAGPRGSAGTNGTDGTNGASAVSFIDGSATLIPAYAASMTLPLKAPVGSAWMAFNQPLFIGTISNGYGMYQVTGIPDALHVTVLNLGYSGNINGNGVLTFADNTRVVPGGFEGPAGLVPAGAFLVANNLNEGVAATMRTNLGLGTAAQQNLAAFFQVANNLSEGVPATMRTNLAVRPGVEVQAYSAFLAGLVAAGPGVADRFPYLTAANVFALATVTAAMRTLLASATNAALLATLKLPPRYGVLGLLTGVNLNAANNDNAVTLSSSRYRLAIVMMENASVNLTTATAGVFTAAGGGGTTLAADQSLAALTASTKYLDLTLQAIAGTDVQTAGTLYYRTGTAQGVAATANVWFIGYQLD